MAKLFALKKIAQPTCDCPSHLCAHGALCAIHYAAILHTVIEGRQGNSSPAAGSRGRNPEG
jgi:hypothetical protein